MGHRPACAWFKNTFSLEKFVQLCSYILCYMELSNMHSIGASLTEPYQGFHLVNVWPAVLFVWFIASVCYFWLITLENISLKSGSEIIECMYPTIASYTIIILYPVNFQAHWVATVSCRNFTGKKFLSRVVFDEN